MLKKAGRLLGNLRSCKRDLLAWKPDAVILIDYPGFNMRIAVCRWKFARYIISLSPVNDTIRLPICTFPAPRSESTRPGEHIVQAKKSHKKGVVKDVTVRPDDYGML